MVVTIQLLEASAHSVSPSLTSAGGSRRRIRGYPTQRTPLRRPAPPSQLPGAPRCLLAGWGAAHPCPSLCDTGAATGPAAPAGDSRGSNPSAKLLAARAQSAPCCFCKQASSTATLLSTRNELWWAETAGQQASRRQSEHAASCHRRRPAPRDPRTQTLPAHAAASLEAPRRSLLP